LDFQEKRTDRRRLGAAVAPDRTVLRGLGRGLRKLAQDASYAVLVDRLERTGSITIKGGPVLIASAARGVIHCLDVPKRKKNPRLE